jgi:hypothetical protein
VSHHRQQDAESDKEISTRRPMSASTGFSSSKFTGFHSSKRTLRKPESPRACVPFRAPQATCPRRAYCHSCKPPLSPI